MKDIYVIVPVYNPIEEITNKFIEELEKEFKNIIIINDGSTNVNKKYFDTFKKHTVLTHHINQGKGRAMKTAFNYLLEEVNTFKGAVVADCDFQHSVKDIKAVSNEVIKNPKKLILGCRDFDNTIVPLRSKLGNKITRSVFQIFVGINISDTQTGLRGYSKELMPTFLSISGERYEYETNMLINVKEQDIKIKEVKIETIYIDGNKSSHFHAIKDSFRIYKLFIKYLLSALTSFILDILSFSLFLSFNLGIILSTIIARIISSIYNFKINEKLIFKKQNKNALYKYYVLATFSMLTSAISVKILSASNNTSIILIKIVVDLIIFILNFIVQREWVFKNK